MAVIEIACNYGQFRDRRVPQLHRVAFAGQGLGRHCPEAYMIKYDLLVYLGLIPLVAVMIFSGFVIWRTPTEADLETRKLRIADAVLVGLLALFIFTAILYFVDAEGAGAEIFNKASPVIFALVGTIVGYIFGTRTKQ
jgi:cytochrome bd-type quinol oxidase subunit 2